MAEFMVAFFAGLCMYAGVGCDQATYWGQPVRAPVVVASSATGTLMERPAPIIGVNFCKRSEYECIEGGAEGRRWGDGGWDLKHDGRYAIRVHYIAKRELPPLHHCSVTIPTFFDENTRNSGDVQVSDWATSQWPPEGFVAVSVSGCAGWAIEARPVQ